MKCNLTFKGKIGALRGISGIFPFFGIFKFFIAVLGPGRHSNLFLDLLPCIWVPGKPSFPLPGSTYSLGCSKIQFPNGRAPNSTPILPFRALINAFTIKPTPKNPSEPLPTPPSATKCRRAGGRRRAGGGGRPLPVTPLLGIGVRGKNPENTWKIPGNT